MDTPTLLATIASASRRPKFAYMLLQLIADAADDNGSAGPYVTRGGVAVPVRDWLCDALIPMGQRDARRQSTMDALRADLKLEGGLPSDEVEAGRLLEERLRERVRGAGRCNVSRTVSELVRIGLLRRHYQGYRVDHHNRGAGREAVYTVVPEVLAAFRRR